MIFSFDSINDPNTPLINFGEDSDPNSLASSTDSLAMTFGIASLYIISYLFRPGEFSHKLGF